MNLAQDWSSEIPIELPGQSMTTTPDFDIDPSNGHLHIVTMIAPEGVLYTEMDKNGNILQQNPIDVAIEDKSSSGLYYGATIAVDPQGRPHVCYRNYHGGSPPKFTSYYTYWNGSRWTSPIELSSRVMRGWVVQIDVDSYGRAHIARGSMADEPGEELVGPVKYFRFITGTLDSTLDNISRYRADDRLEIDASYQNQVHLILGCPDYPTEGGPVWYWRSFDGGNNWFKSEIHDDNARDANGAPDLFVDASGNVHIVYGSENDLDVGKEPSVRYTRFTNNTQSFDVPVTVEREIFDRADTPQGFGSVAASSDGQIVIVVYSEDFGERLFARESHDGGQNWSDRTLIASNSCGNLGRNRQIIRAYRDKFYVMYPSPTGVKLRYKMFSQNQPPVADAGGPYAGDEGSAISFNASGSSDPEGNITKYEWDFQNDGIWDDITTSPYNIYTYSDNFNGQVRVRVTDVELEMDTDLANVTIYNVPPEADAGGPYGGDIGEIIHFQGNATDPGNDVITYVWDLNNDGIFETNGQNVQTSFQNGGTYKVILKVDDDDGGSDVDTAYVSIQNNPPIIENIPDQTVNESESFTPINLYRSVTDPDNSDDQIGWTFLNVQNLIISNEYDSLLFIAVIDSEWNGTESIMFIATDPGQLSDTTWVNFTIIPVNDPPRVGIISVPAIYEGEESFEFIFLDTHVSDPDNDNNELSWTVHGQVELNANIDTGQRVAIISPPHKDWYGTEELTFVVTDQNGSGLSDSTRTTFTVYPVNDPPVINRNLNQSIMYIQNFKQVLLDTCVTDVDNSITEIQWSYFGNNQLKVDITNRILTVTKPDPDWLGSENVTFIASDGELSDTTTATFTVIYHNDPPVISSLQGETINENGQFATIYLDEKVHDPDHSDNLLTWSYQGNVHLNIAGIAQRILQITVPDSEWAGSETIKFMVTDPGGLKDSADAIFTVIPINDPPVLNPIPDFAFNEDTTFTITSAELKLMAVDVDNPFHELQFSIGNNTHTHSIMDPQTGNMLLSADPNWNGIEEVQFIVYDNQYASDSQPIKITVNPRPDPPLPFQLLKPPYGTFFSITPQSIDFIWQKAIDPDQDESLTYTWDLSHETNFAHIIDRYNALTDTSLTYQIPSIFYPGIYYWRVIALDGTGNSTPCHSIGAFNMEHGIGVESEDDSNIPEKFALLPNHPNPFNPETKITYHLPTACHVRLKVYNSLGQLINTLLDQERKAGIYSTYWNGRNDKNEPVSSGIYIFKIEADNFIMARKMLLLQ